jgi:uncharacterized protein
MAAAFPPPTPGTLLVPPHPMQARRGAPASYRSGSPPIAPPVFVMLPPPGWYADPWRLAPIRWWDGRAWTSHVWHGAVMAPTAEPPVPPFPLRAGVIVLAILAVTLAVQRVTVPLLQRHDVPLLLVLALSVLLAYGPALIASLMVARRWSPEERSPLRALAFRVRPADIGWGLLTWLAIVAGNRALVTVIQVFHLPMSSNVRIGGGAPSRHLLIASTLVAVVAAPIVEEIIFRGVVLRAFRSVMPTKIAIVAQAVLFGLAHVQAAFGAGNLGLVLLLSWAGVGLGFVAHHFRRLGPSLCAHVSVNAVVFLVVWLAPQLVR